MKIAIPSMGKDLKSSISRKLGRAPFIIIYNSVSDEYDSIENPGFQNSGWFGSEIHGNNFAK